MFSGGGDSGGSSSSVLPSLIATTCLFNPGKHFERFEPFLNNPNTVHSVSPNSTLTFETM